MASLQAHLIVLGLKLFVKRRNRSTNMDAHAVRAMFDRAPPVTVPGTEVTPITLAGLDGERVRPADGAVVGTMFYLHGGGYIACSPRTHRRVTGGYARRGLEVVAPAYRLAPEHPFPAALDDAHAAYLALLEQGVPSGRIVFGGDSAGGGLALALLLRLRDENCALPAGAALFSPWTDLTETSATLRSNARRDALFPGTGMARLTAPYLAGADPAEPLVSPLFGDHRGLPPLLLHVGSHEVLLDDSRSLAARAAAAGVAVTLRTWPVVPHVWQMFRMPEADASLDQAAAFARRRPAPRSAGRRSFPSRSAWSIPASPSSSPPTRACSC